MRRFFLFLGNKVKKPPQSTSFVTASWKKERVREAQECQ